VKDQDLKNMRSCLIFKTFETGTIGSCELPRFLKN
jgi:hypothetical protein